MPEAAEKSISRLLGYLHSAQKRPDWANVKGHLAKKYPRIHAQFARLDDDGFEAAGRDPFEVWVSDKLLAESKESDKTDSPSPIREAVMYCGARRPSHIIMG
jgi:hypothetical protein